MEASTIQYVRTPDGYDISYSVTGSGRPLVLLPWGLVEIRFAGLAAGEWISGLCERFRLVQYDGRGRGLSTRGLLPTLHYLDYNRDLETVIDNLGLEDFFLLARGGFGHTAIRYAASHPGRVRALILANCAMSISAYPKSLTAGLSAENWEYFVRSFIPLSFPAEQYASLVDHMRDCYTPEDWQTQQKATLASDVSEVVKELRIPTLVLHAPRYLMVAPEEEIALSAGIAGARLVSLEGGVLQGDAAEGLAAIDKFVAEIGEPGFGSTKEPAADPRSVGLSTRQIEVLRLIAEGKTTHEIAETLVLSERTVQRHIADIYAKIGARNRAEATAFAVTRLRA